MFFSGRWRGFNSKYNAPRQKWLRYTFVVGTIERVRLCLAIGSPQAGSQPDHARLLDGGNVMDRSIFGLGKHGSILRQAAFARRLRYEPLEDRRVLSITLFVDADAAPSGNGLAWASAFDDLQDALTQAATYNADGNASNDVDEIWIAEGTYTPSALLESDDARSASFSLLDGVTLYGGFVGNETTLAERDWSTHVTTLSGELGLSYDNSDNAYTVVFCSENIEAAIDGIAITGGNANHELSFGHFEKSRGGGVYNDGMLSISNSIIFDNTAKGCYGHGLSGGGDGYGGGIYNAGSLFLEYSTLSYNLADDGYGGAIYNYGALDVSNSSFHYNSAGGGFGGAIHNNGTTATEPLTIENSSFMGNAAARGGGIMNYSGAITISNSAINGNSASYGGGIFSEGINGPAALVLSDSTISGNTAANNGGGINNNFGAMAVSGTSISDNSAPFGGGLFNSSNEADFEVAFSNSTFFNNAADLGGGILNARGMAWVCDSRILWNRANYGGGIYNDGRDGPATLELTNSAIFCNLANFGGGIHNNGSNGDTVLRATNSTFTGN